MVEVERSIIVESSPEILFDVITDYERYPEFISENKAVTIIERREGVAVVEFEIDVIKRIRYRLKLIERPFDRVEWSLVSGFFKKNEGFWRIEDRKDGSVKATYFVKLEMGLFIPGPIIKRLTEVSLPKMLQSFKQRAEGLEKRKTRKEDRHDR